jgi:tetratricopeptide (TPR) repeat protein
LALEPHLDVIHLLRSRAYFALARREEARTEALRFLALVPASVRGWSHLAAVESALGDRDAALAAFARYFALAQQPLPEDYLARAELLRSTGDFEGALRGLDEGVARLGPLTSLLARELELERQRADPAGALAIVDRLIAASPQDERWLIARAETLARLGRAEEAGSALELARTALAARPPARRDAPALREVRERIDQLTRKLAAP